MHIRLALLAVLVSVIIGCGGGGNSPPPLPANTARIQIDLSWAGRSRDVKAPGSALSAAITLKGAGQDGSDFSFIVNRDAAPAAYTRTETSTDGAKLGAWPLTVTFYADKGGSGSVVATAMAQVRLNAGGKLVKPDGSDLGAVFSAGTITNVEIPFGQRIDVGKPSDLMVTATDGSHNVIAVSPGSITYFVDTNSNLVEVSGGALQGIAPGGAQVHVVVDGVQSPLQTIIVSPKVTVRTLNLRANDIVYDSKRSRIYASVPSIVGGGLGNSIARIDPVSGTVESSVFVGSEPNRLAISDDGAFLYVGLDGANSVRRVTLSSFTADLQFSLPLGPISGPTTAGDIEVAPGNPHEIAVALLDGNSVSASHGVTIFDDGVARPNTGPAIPAFVSVLAFGADASRLYGYAAIGSGDFARFHVDQSGLMLLDDTRDLATGFADIQFAMGKLYDGGGHVIDPEARTIVGTFDVSGLSNLAALRLDLPGSRFYAIGLGTPSIANLAAYDASTLRRVALVEVVIGSQPSLSFGTRSLIEWGAGRLAFSALEGAPLTGTDESKIVFVSDIPAQ